MNAQFQPRDKWGTWRIWVAVAFGAIFSANKLVFDFCSLGKKDSSSFVLRAGFDLLTIFLILPIIIFVVCLLISAGVALWQYHFRQAASSILAIAAMPVCFVVVAYVSLFDPWIWYAMANYTRFKALAENNPSSAGSRYAVIETRDVTAVPVFGPNHFVAIVYDESDAIGLDPARRSDNWHADSPFPSDSATIPKGKRLYGYLFRVDEYE